MTAEAIAADDERASGAARLAWLLWLAVVALCAIAFVIQLGTGNAWIPGAYGAPGFTSLFALAYGTVGALIVSRRSTNLVGRVLLVAGLVEAFQSLYTEYAIAAYLGAQGQLPFAPVAAWFLAWAWVPFVFVAGPLLLSIFPDGHVLSPRWRLVPIAVAVVGAVWMFVAAFKVGPLENFAVLDNPFGFISVDLAQRLTSLLIPGMALAFVLPAASLVLRYRRSDTDRRHQLKWIAVAGLLLAISAPAGFSLGKPGQLLFIVAFCTVPVATGIAVLRYRLYEIDTIINRALVYGLLTAVIAGIYTASVGVMQRLSHEITGADSEATVVVTTVLIVAAFTPIKTRVQALVDRRFRDAGDAKTAFNAFTKTFQERTWPIDRRLALRRFAETAVTALRAASAEVSVGPDGERAVAVARPQSSGKRESAGGSWSTVANAGSIALTLRVVAGERELSARDREEAKAALEALASELAEP